MSLPIPSAATTATAHVLHKVGPGQGAALEDKIAAVLAIAAKADGYLTSSATRLRAGSDASISVLVHFASRQQLDAWHNSHAAQRHLAELAPIEFAEGAAGWFTLPEAPRPVPPPKWKMTVVTWLAIFPLLTVFISASFHLLGDLPMIARLFLNTVLIAPLMTWVIMPLMMRMFARWLFART